MNIIRLDGGKNLFIEPSLEEEMGVQSELKVWNAVKNHYSKGNSFGFLHYPIFNSGHQGRREIDILLVDRATGISVIEVKGLYINQIKSIQGHVWYYQNFYSDKGNPYSQAESQMYKLGNEIDKRISFKHISHRAVVALPKITRKEWESRGFHEMIHNPPILFKDDIENNIAKLEDYYVKKVNKLVDDVQWNKIIKLFCMEEEVQSFKDLNGTIHHLSAIEERTINDLMGIREEDLLGSFDDLIASFK